MTISAKVIADSIGPKSPRLTTFQLRYPRFIHAEVMTHRVFSRNASSSRAIPVETMIRNIREDTAMPIHWGKNQPGMQAHEQWNALVGGEGVSGYDHFDNMYDGIYREEAWLKARDHAINVAAAFHKAGYHKQIVNRLLEPFMHIDVIVTATDFSNFYWLRRHADAQPEIKVLADAMWEAQQASMPKKLSWGEWHLPYITEEDWELAEDWLEPYPTDTHKTVDLLIKACVARCARVSYLTHDGKKPDFDKDLALYDRLVGSEPLHASPAEHQATPDTQVWDSYELPMWEREDLSGNLGGGWIQYRKTLPGERCTIYAG